MKNISIPVIQEFIAKDHNSIPAGMKMACMQGPDSLKSSDKCPVILWNTYIYCPYSYTDNRYSMGIVAYSDDKKVAKIWEGKGARYVYKITVDEKAETITFWGQSNKTIVKKWSELYLMTPPLEGRIPTKVHPKLPNGLKTTCLKNHDKLDPSDMYPVVQYNGLTYWALSYIDNRNAMNIAAYDTKGNLVKQWEKTGARYIFDIEVDCAAQSIIFIGQSNQSVKMGWDELVTK